jgi:hypothetical protein
MWRDDSGGCENRRKANRQEQAMNRFLAVAMTGALALGTKALPQTASAASVDAQAKYFGRYCDRHPGDPDCRDWRVNRRHWDRDRYHRWYSRHRHEFGPDDAAAAIFGFAAGEVTGALAGAANGAATSAHVAACEAQYRSYDPQTDQYLGYDGNYHYCRL